MSTSLQPLVRRIERDEVEADAVGEDLMAEAHGEQRRPDSTPRRDDLAHAGDAGASRLAWVARAGTGDQ